MNRRAMELVEIVASIAAGMMLLGLGLAWMFAYLSGATP